MLGLLALTAHRAWAADLSLEPYWKEKAPGLVVTTISIDGHAARLLFDTGAGLTSITPAFARRVGCEPYGSVTGFRMRGDRVTSQKCGSRQLTIGSQTIAREIAVFDLSALLPSDAPPIDGIMGVDVFDGRLITLVQSRAIVMGSRPGLGWREGTMRLQRELSGAGLEVFVRATAVSGDIWLLLDTGHIGPVFLSPGAVEQMGSPRPDLPISLVVSGAGSRETKAAHVEGLIYDGVLGEPFLRGLDIAIDFRQQRIWWRPTH